MVSRIFPRALVVCIALGVFLTSTPAQNPDIRAKRTKQIQAEGIGNPAYVTDDPQIISVAENTTLGEEIRPNRSLVLKTVSPFARYQPLLADAIDERLGSPYHWGSTGPNSFDCSGFVWSTFHTAGIDFERGSARTLWSRFETPASEDQFKFGTLVFFSGQTHVGIVVDEHGFYHASRHHGVVYAPFNKYWASRVDGYRRVPLPAQATAQRTEE